MGKFKIGDKVRAKVDWLGVKAGAEYMVDYIDEDGDVLLGVGRWYMTDDELELVTPEWQPKVGDRVRVKNNTTRGGSTIDRYPVGADLTVTKVYADVGDGLGPGYILEDHTQYLLPHQIEPAPLRIEAGKFYKTRDGRKVGPMKAFLEDRFIVDVGDGNIWFTDGKAGSENNIRIDLIAECTAADEPPQQPATPATTLGDIIDISKRFKLGDRVKGKKMLGNDYVEGEIAQIDPTDSYSTYRVKNDRDSSWVRTSTVVALPAKSCKAAEVDTLADEYGPGVAKTARATALKAGDRVRITRARDAFGHDCPGLADEIGTIATLKMRYSGVENRREPWTAWTTHENVGWVRSDDVELLSVPATPTAIVCLIENGQPKPASRPYVHATATDAQAEANRLALEHKGQAFGVYVLIGEPARVEQKLKVGDKVALSGSARVTGHTNGKVNVVLDAGGSFVLPSASLTAA